MQSTQILQHTWGVGNPYPKVEAKLAFIDPPYNQGIIYDDDLTQDRLKQEDYKDWVFSTICEIEKCLLPGGTMWWLCPQAHADFIPYFMGEAGLTRLYTIIKQESFAQYQQHKLTEDYRLLYVYVKSGGIPLIFNPHAIRIKSQRQLVGDKRADPRGRVPGQVWNIRRLQGTAGDRCEWHPCQLPPELLERIVLGWSNPGDVVMDAFAGSGNMGIICKVFERQFVGVDSSPTYCNKIRERLTNDNP